MTKGDCAYTLSAITFSFVTSDPEENLVLGYTVARYISACVENVLRIM